MNFNKKYGQTATEYLIILAVVIIIALIVVGVLGGIPGIGGSSGSNIADLYFETSTIGVSSVAMTATGADTLILRNNNAVDIDVTNISVGSTPIWGNITDPITILKGQTKTITNSTSLMLLQSDFVTCAVAGDSFSETLTVTYVDKKTEASYTFVSEQKLEGECAN